MRILIVDDNPDTRDTLHDVFENLGHEVETAANAGAALALAERLAPELVICDLAMPGVDGLRICQELRKVPELATALFVAHTGYGSAAMRERAAEAGFDHLLLKPVEQAKWEQLLSGGLLPSSAVPAGG